jgi:acyl carrier protein
VALAIERADVLDRLAAIIRKQLRRPQAEITERTTARDIPGWDSLAQVAIVLAVERAFKLRLSSTEMARLDGVGSLADLVVARGKP